MIRKGFKEWADAGFPRNDDGSPKSDMSRRGTDNWIKLSWDEATTIAAKTLENVARTYNGEDGAEKLLEQDYDPAMVEAMHGAGVQTIKMRGGMPLLGVGRIFGFYRFANMLALLDTPTKVIWFGNSNSLLGNAKWSFDVVKNTLPRQDAIFCNEWHWTSSCEYADLVFPADSWAEFKLPDMTASCTNPFLLAFPTTPLARIHNSRSDYEILALTARKLGELVQEPRMTDYWKGVLDGDPSPYLQRILSGSNATRGTTFEDPPRIVEGRHAPPDERAHLPEGGRVGAARKTSPGTRRPDGSSSIAPSGSSRRRARRCPSGTSPSTRRFTTELDPLQQGSSLDQAARPRELRGAPPGSTPG